MVKPCFQVKLLPERNNVRSRCWGAIALELELKLSLENLSQKRTFLTKEQNCHQHAARDSFPRIKIVTSRLV